MISPATIRSKVSFSSIVSQLASTQRKPASFSATTPSGSMSAPRVSGARPTILRCRAFALRATRPAESSIWERASTQPTSSTFVVEPISGAITRIRSLTTVR